MLAFLSRVWPMRIATYWSRYFRLLPLLTLWFMSGCVKLPEQQNSAWPWEYGGGQGEPNIPDYVSFRAGVANFDEPPRAVKPIVPKAIGSVTPETQPTIMTSPAVKTETSAKWSVETDKAVATPNKDYNFRVGEKNSVSALLKPLNSDNASKVITAFNNGCAPVSVVINMDRSTSQNASTSKPLPYYAVVPANTDTSLVQLSPQQRGGSYSYQWIIGDYTARHNCPEPYLFPFDKKTRAYAQVNDAKNSTPYNRYSVIFSVPKGTTVLAARKGTVVRSQRDGEIDMLHEDATIGTYSHLENIALTMVAGKTVTTEDVIGIAGTAENNKDAYMQLTVWRPEPRTSSTLLISTQQIGFDAVSFPLPFSAMASEKGNILMKSQTISRGNSPILHKKPKKRPKGV